MSLTSPRSPNRRDSIAMREPDGSTELTDLLSMPGYLIRRSKQITTSAFTDVCREFAITPVQFAAMSILNARPGVDQTEFGELAGLDASTTGDVIQRLEKRGLLSRSEDGNRRICNLTPDGCDALDQLRPIVAAAQTRVLAPLTGREQAQLLRLLSKLNGVSNRHYTSPPDRRLRRRGKNSPLAKI